MKKARILLQVVIGVIIIAFILNKLNIKEVISVLRETDFTYFILACLAYLCMNVVLASRLGYLLNRIGYNIKFPTVLISHLGGMVVGDVTPGRSGYFLTPAILKKKAGCRITDGMACIFAPQAVEFILKVAGAIAAILFISTLPGISRDILIPAGIGVAFLFIAGVLMLIISWRNETISTTFIRKLPFLGKFTENLSLFKERSIQIKGSINAILMLYMISWVFAGLQWYYLGKALGIPLSFFAFFLLHPLITILMFVPISPAGLGLMEGGVILIFSLFGVSSAMALGFSVLVRLSILLVDMIGLKTVLTSLRDLQL
ncbi:Lysylphosphatidylglycerol synthase TM region [uncultured archaeon]|nr:Lysylphosphatidylglycerol synthase TM region [uncultured archaeon]